MRPAHSHDRTRREKTALLPNTRPTILAVLGVLLLSGGLILATSAPAAAHDDIVSAYPEAGSTVGVIPEEITLTFSGEIFTDTSAVVIEVLAPDGRNVAAGPALIDGTTVVQPLIPDQGPGLFTVRWRVVSSDGHPISDEYTYTVEAFTVPTSTPTPGETVAEQTPEPSPTSTDAASTGGHGEPSGGGAMLPVLAILSGVIVLGSAVLIVLMVGRERRHRDRAAAATAAAKETEVDADES